MRVCMAGRDYTRRRPADPGPQTCAARPSAIIESLRYGDSYAFHKQRTGFDWTLVFDVLADRLVSTLGSRFLAKSCQYPPCVLCWYQRICMYPLVLILPARHVSVRPEHGAYASVVAARCADCGVPSASCRGYIPEASSPAPGRALHDVQIEWFWVRDDSLLSGCPFWSITALLILTTGGFKVKQKHLVVFSAPFCCLPLSPRAMLYRAKIGRGTPGVPA